MRSAPWFPCLLLLTTLILGSLGLQAQDIGIPVISPNPRCAGSNLDISFVVTNGNGNRRFDNNSTFFIYLGYISGGIEISQEVDSFSSNSTPNGNWETSTISRTILIPNNLSNRSDYRIFVSSVNPEPESRTKTISQGFSIPLLPVISSISNNGPICVGGTLNLSASNIFGATYSWSGPGGYVATGQNPTRSNANATMAGVYTVIATVNGCTSTPASTTVGGSVSTDSQFSEGANFWDGHVYDGINFNTYVGIYSEPETFDQSFGGNTTCFNIISNSNPISIYTETFSVRYRMKSTKKGLYVVDLGSDDGSRLTVDGTVLYNNWSDQAWSLRQRVLMNLTGNSQLVYDFYENGGGNRVNFNNLTLILENKLTGNTNQTICSGTTAAAISGDTFGTLPAGLSAAGYQWTYSTSPVGTRNNISGAISASFTPNINAAPFNIPGTYYIFRNARLSSGNNISPNPYVATNESNPAILTVKSKPNAPTVSNNGPVCVGSTLNLLASIVSGATYNWTGPNGFTSTSRNPSITNATDSMAGIYSVTATVEGCSSNATTTNVVVNAIPTITGTTPGSRCGTGIVVLGGTASAGTINWYAAATGGASLGTGTTFTTPSITSNTTYYVDATEIASGCTTGTRTAVIAKVNTIPSAPTAGSNSPVCAGGTINLTASSIVGATYSWTGPNGFTSNLQNPSRANVSTAMAGTYTVTITVNACTSVGASTNVIVNASYNWTGNTNSDWNTSSNWACNSIPNLNLNVIIPGGLTNYPILNSGALGMAKDIQINSGATLTVLDNTLQIAGSALNSGIFNSLNGSVAFVGAIAQTIPANTFSANRVRNLIINNNVGVSSLGNLEITGFLRVENGNFNTGNKLTLISNATQTALIDGSGNGQVVGLVTMQRYLDVAFGYKYFSSPFSNSLVGDFSSYIDLNATFPNFYIYDENRQDASVNDATGWKAYTTSTNSLGILKGYALNFGDSSAPPKTVEISGTVNNGNQLIALINNNRTYTKGFNLVGNPYPAPIDWNAATGWTKTNIDDALYFFTAGNIDQYTGTYSSYIGTTSSDGKSSNIIPSMQGFFVKVTMPGNATLGVTNSVRTNNYTQQFLKVKEPEKVALIRITAAFENEVNIDPAVIYFPHFAELSFEKDKDALKLMNTDVAVPNLYSLTPENKKLSINALPKPGSSDVEKIPLGLKTEKDGWMLIGLKDLDNLPSNFNVYLIDSEKRIGQNLSRKPLYRFYAKSGQHESRFHLMFSETELSDPAIAFDEPFSVRTLGGKVMVSMNLETGQSGVLLASTVTGQILERKNVSEKEIIEIEGIKSSGVYFFSINLKDGMFSKKLLIQK